MATHHEHKSNSDKETWQRLGFVESEAYRMEEMSTKGASSSAVMLMRRHRRGLKANAKRYKWSDERYLNAVIKEYEHHGIPDFHGYNAKNAHILKMQYIGKHFYDYLGAFKQAANELDPTWKGTPRPKAVHKGVSKAQKTVLADAKDQRKVIKDKMTNAIKQHDMKEWHRLQKEADGLDRIIYGR